MEKYSNTALVFGNLKDALLHFEYVIPMNLVGGFMGLEPADAHAGARQVRPARIDSRHELAEFTSKREEMLKIYPPGLRANKEFLSSVDVCDSALLMYMIRHVYGQNKLEEYLTHLVDVMKRDDPGRFASDAKYEGNKSAPTAQGLRSLFSLLVRRFDLGHLPVDSSHFTATASDKTPSANILKAHEVRVIDTSKVHISQILSFRENKDAMSKMRNFRLFAYEQYTGKEKAFVEDDIQKRLDEYQRVVKASGFETTLNSLSFLCESRLLGGSLATSAASLLLGGPKLAVSAFSAGLLIEIGKLTLEYAKTKHTLSEICSGNPISYISEVRSKLGLER